ncbi:cI repressor protein [Pseudomonas sp. NIBR-H-19]|uniref:XRE family transcriptional regulator n=1 Tax=Pseudomonas sp. NIBR-H-19 TaxID=2901380 RepID=UPI001E38BBF7|nr:S24 family peptidase [Pseudomonas sp. NIBR-H-19]UHC81691.1 cI repressor protein [Pseudomonas sp. NIBR-H-19]
MNKPTRTPLAPWQLEDAGRLREIYKKRVKESKDRGDGKVLNQTEVGERCGWNSPQSAFSQYANGKVALNLDALIRLSKALEFQPAEVSPTLANGVAVSAEEAAPKSGSPAPETPIPAGGEPDVYLDHRYSFVPQYSAKAAAGIGHENPHVETLATLAFKREWLKMKGLNEKHLIVIYADGDSMWPTINHHDVLLLDTSKTEPADRQIFVLTSSDKGTIVKRLIKTAMGGWIIRSDNDDCDDYADVMLARSEVNEHRIIGKVVWRGGDL